VRDLGPADKRDAARASAAALAEVLRKGGAVNVKIEEEVIAETRARAPEIARASTLTEKLEALWSAKQFDPGARREALLGKASDLEGNRAA
jgi:hypothetical protein